MISFVFFIPLFSCCLCVTLLLSCFSVQGVRRCEDGCRPLTPWSTCVSTHSPSPPSAWMGICLMFPSPLSLGLQALPTVSGTTLTFSAAGLKNSLYRIWMCRNGDWWLTLQFSGTQPCLILVLFFLWLFPHSSLWSQCWTSSPSLPPSRPPPLRASCTMGGLRRKLPAYWAVEMRIWHPNWPMASTRSPQSTCEFPPFICNVEVKQDICHLKNRFTSHCTLCIVQIN